MFCPAMVTNVPCVVAATLARGDVEIRNLRGEVARNRERAVLSLVCRT